MLKIKTLLIILATLAVGEALLAVAGYVTLTDASPQQEKVTAVEPRVQPETNPVAVREWSTRIEHWRQAREDGDTTAVYTFYAPDFQKMDGKTFADFRQEVQKHLSHYSWRRITIDSLRLFTFDQNRIATFREKYYCPGFYLVQEKTLWCSYGDSTWQINAEKDSNLTNPQYPDQFIPRFVFEWRNAWESANFENYISYYDSSFQTGAYTYTSWFSHKKQLFQKIENIRVDVSDFEFINIAPTVWKVAFVQRYVAPNHEDWGQKVLRITGSPGNFKITHETWIPLQAYAQ